MTKRVREKGKKKGKKTGNNKGEKENAGDRENWSRVRERGGERKRGR